MKNNLDKIFFCIFLLFQLLVFDKKVNASEIEFNSKEIDLVNENEIKASGEIEIKDISGLNINGDKLYFNKKRKILEIEENVLVFDKSSNYSLKAEKIIFYQLDNTIISKGKTIITNKNNFTLETFDIIYDRSAGKISSKKESLGKDKFKNRLRLSNFNLDLNEGTINSKKARLTDSQLNIYKIDNFIYDYKIGQMLGSDLNVNINNNLSLIENMPRFKGKSFYSNQNNTIVKKGVFTTCKKREGCPPWLIAAEEIEHDKEKKIINYKNAWLKFYDQPVLYFPKFFHPDPSVKRQSGFLMPTLSQTKNFSNYLKTPYFKVIADNVDLTFSPRIYDNDSILYQAEYRHLTKNSDHILDFSVKNDKLILLENESTKTHFFSESIIKTENKFFEESLFNIKIQKTSDSDYIKSYDINSPIISSQNLLNSKIEFTGFRDDIDLLVSTEVFEDLGKNRNDRYEFIIPNFNFDKEIETNLTGSLKYSTSGYGKFYDTNVSEKVLINNLSFNSSDSITTNGLVNNYEILIKNFNADSKNSSEFKNKNEHDLQGIINFQSKLPLQKKGVKYNSLFTPIFSARYNPYNNKNLKNKDRMIDFNNIYSINRIGSNETLEGGQSITLGSEFKIDDKVRNINDLLKLNLATSFRDSENGRLPKNSTLDKKMSNLIGQIKFKPNNTLNFDYNFLADNNLDQINYHKINTTISVNNFINKFEFLEENNDIGKESFVSNETKFKFGDNSDLSFKTRQNKTTNLTEYYNLIYQYKMDCLVAGVEYRKDYYTDKGLKPDEKLFFSVTIVPFQNSIKSPPID